MSEQRKTWPKVIVPVIIASITAFAGNYYLDRIKKAYKYKVRVSIKDTCVIEKNTKIIISQKSEELDILPIDADILEFVSNEQITSDLLQVALVDNKNTFIEEKSISGKIISVFISCKEVETELSTSQSKADIKHLPPSKKAEISTKNSNTNTSNSLITTNGQIIGTLNSYEDIKIKFLGIEAPVNENGRFSLETPVFEDYAPLEILFNGKIIFNENYYPGSSITINLDDFKLNNLDSLQLQ